MSLHQNERAMSDVVGTSMLLVVTVVAVGAAAVAFSNAGGDRPDTPRVDVLANATASSDAYVTLRHAGGPSIPYDSIQAVISSTSWSGSYRGPVQPQGSGAEFGLGSTAYARVTGNALAAGDKVDVLLYYGGTGILFGGSSFTVASTNASGPGTLTDFLLSAATSAASDLSPGSSIAIFADVAHPEGRKVVERVVVDASAVGGPIEVPLHDDGTRGDATAGDGRYAGFVQIPIGATAGAKTLAVRAYDIDGRMSDPAAGQPAILLSILSLPSGAPGAGGAAGGAGTNGTTGTGGGLPGASGADGAPSTAPGPAGAAGTPGARGANGTSDVPTPATPEITGWSADWGAPGAVFQLFGTELVRVQEVTFYDRTTGATYTALWASDLVAPLGTALYVAVPHIPDAFYVISVRTDGGWANAPDPEGFEVVWPLPIVSTVTPGAAGAYENIILTGANFSHTTAVTLFKPGIPPIAVPWSVQSDSLLSFVTHPGIPRGVYDVRVSAGAKMGAKPLSFESLVPDLPTVTDMDPDRGRVEAAISITGERLETVSRVTLSQANGTRVVDAVWYAEGGRLVFRIPIAAAAEGPWDLPYTVQLRGSFNGVVEVPETLTVQATPPPTVNCPFGVEQGEPFTQVRVTGSNFVNVRSVSYRSQSGNENAVYYTVTSPNEIITVTHAGLAQGLYNIKVVTATGAATSSCTFKALPLRIVPIYNTTMISSFAVNLSVLEMDNNAQVANVTVKLQNASGWRVATPAGSRDPVFQMIAVYHTFQKSSADRITLGQGDGAVNPVCSVTTNGIATSMWTSTEQPLLKYNSFANEFDYYFGIKMRNTTSGLETWTYVVTNAQNSNFILPAGTFAQTILDRGTFPTNADFRTCNP